MEQKRLFLLDAYALIFRAYYAMLRTHRTTASGLNTSAIFGFVNTLQDLLKRENPTHIAVCFDPAGKTFRHEEYPAYKAQREATPEDIKLSVPYIKQILDAYNITVCEVPGFEADDVVGTLSRLASERGYQTFMVTGDKDFGQLVKPNVKIYNPSKNEILGVAEVNAKYGLESPLQVIDLLGLMGDTADNIPGCPGVGPKTAEKLIAAYGSIENLLDHTDELKGSLKQKVSDNAEQIRLSKHLATIRTDVPIEFDDERFKRVPVDYVKLREVFSQLEFRTLTTRIIDHGEANVGLDGVAASGDAADAQLSLFGDEAAVAANAAPALHNSFSAASCTYTMVSDADEAAAIVKKLLTLNRVAVHIVADGDEAMRAQVVGYALCGAKGTAYYMPADGFGWITEAVKPLFAGKACIVSGDVKRDMVILKNLGVDFTAPYYDTGVAHYLLQPERYHDTASVAETLLGYVAISPDTVLGTKGKKLGYAAVAPDKLTNLACELADLTLQLPDVLNAKIEEIGLTHLLTDVELPLVEVLADMELTGARIDVKALNDYSVTLTSQMNKLEQECFELAGEKFNTASPAQVGEVLFDKLKIDDKAKKTKTGQYSTTEEILLRLRDRHPLVGHILELRGIRKLLSTYVNALPELINPRTGRIHTTYNQTVTATGRLSSANPNLQNIPVRTDDGKEIRRAFIPADGNLFFSADYSQIELRLVADLSHDETMLDAFAHNVDVHALTASRIYHEPIESVTPEQRRRAKTANFGILYGISAFGLSERLQIPRSEAKMLIDGYYETFPKVKEYKERCIAHAKEKGYVTTLYGRRRMLPEINSRNAVVRGFSERNAVNAPIQGTAADIIKVAMVRIFGRFKAEGLKSKMILQVHDELNFDVVPSELPVVSSIVIGEMENAYKGDVKLEASHGVAANWLDAH
ncbi:MAG: DNA polymerase I [Sodaliphilus sp.]|nr:DNA polymerase I [Sodaliphilus sp.]